MIKKIIKKLMRHIFFVIIVVLILFGLIQHRNMSKKNTIFKGMITTIGNTLYQYLQTPEKYNFEDDFEVTSSLDFNLESEEYEEKSYIDPDYYKKYHLITNLSNLDSHIVLKQSKEKGKLLLSFDNKIGEEDIYTGKVYIENSTQYYMVNKILNNYVNEGNNSYFETLTHSNTTSDNINYLYQTIINSLKKNIRDEELKENKAEIVVNDKNIKVRQISLKITDKYYKVLLKRILNDLKKDSRSSLILESTIPNFNTLEVNDEIEYLKNDEYYTINIYVRNILNTPIKYELIHTKDNDNYKLALIGNLEKGNIYYYDNNQLKYTANYEATPKIMEIIVKNDKETAGFIKIEKSNNSLSMNINLALENSNIDFTYSGIYKNYKKNNSYDKEDSISIKWLEEDKVRLNGTINSATKVKKEFKIDEDIEDSLLRFSLDDETKEKLDNALNNMKERLES